MDSEARLKSDQAEKLHQVLEAKGTMYYVILHGETPG